MKITVLFCQDDSIYKKLNGRNRVSLCEVYDEKRNALNYTGHAAAIYHPPCRLWSRMRKFSTADENEKYLAVWSVRKVQQLGGILEHPGSSLLFDVCQLPKPGSKDEFGFTIEVDQFHFGHKARKRTWLYIVGLPMNHPLLFYKFIPGAPKYVVSTSSNNNKLELNSYERSATPKKFAKWLVKICTEINNLKASK